MPSPSSKMRATLVRERSVGRRNAKTIVVYVVGLAIVLLAGIVVFKRSYDASVEAQGMSRRAKETLLKDDADLKEERVKLKEAREKLEKMKRDFAVGKEDSRRIEGELSNAKTSCKSKRMEREEHDKREIDDVTWELKTAAYKRLQQFLAQVEDEQGAREQFLVNNREEAGALESEAKQLRTVFSEQETDRVLYRVLGNVSRSYVSAYYQRLRRGSFHDSYGLNTQAVLREQALGHINAGMWYVGDSGERANLNVNPSNLLEVLPKKDPLGDTFPRGGVWRSCAVVGWSGLLSRMPLGAKIDEHDAIFRFNDAPTKGYEEYVGRRTTIRLVEDRYFKEARDRPSREQVFQYITRQETLNEYIKYKNEHERESTNLNLLAPNYHFHISRFLKRSAPFQFLGVAIAAQKCRSVTVFGIVGSQWRGNLPYHYYDDRQPPPRVKSAAGAMRDEDGVAMVFISELAARPELMVRIVEPCLMYRQCFGAEVNASVMPISEGGMCSCEVPYPLPRRGWCADSAKANVYANCFRKCPRGAGQCPGGANQEPCEKLGVNPEDSELVGPMCDA
mmetsp:Transcript_52101/g.166150  ORF Transcript_52101/g.166150 Transcript_52101/m.166150 type:complete len:563 (+) Transcript_52101:165-1853(+)